MIALRRATPLFGLWSLILLLPVSAIAAEQVASVAQTLRPRQGQATVVAPANEPVVPAQAPAPAAVATTAASSYVPKTSYDNSPYRFNAGARFTAAEFDAWMKSRGIRVAKGKPAAAEPATKAAAGSACDTEGVNAC